MKYFYTNIFGDAYVPYLKSLLVSIDKFYTVDTKFIVVYDNISEWEIFTLKKLFPEVDFISDDLILLETKSIHHLIANKSKGWSNFISSLNDDDKVIFLDVDTNVLKIDIWNLFDDFNFDLALTTYTVGYKLNTGVIFLNVNTSTKQLFQSWSDHVFEIFLTYLPDKIEFINKQFGAVDQYVFCKLAELDKNSSLNDSYLIELDNENVVKIKLLDGNIYNLINSNNFSPDTKVIHFKSGWRNILNKNKFFNLNRNYNSSVIQYGIWYDNYLDSIYKEKIILKNDNFISNNSLPQIESVKLYYSLRDLNSILNLSDDKPILIDISFNLKDYFFFEILKWYFEFVISFVHKRSSLINISKEDDKCISRYIILPFLQGPAKKYYFLIIYFIIYLFSIFVALYSLLFYSLKLIILKLYFSIKNDK